MNAWFWWSYGGLWMLVLIQAAVVLLLLRQVGLIHLQIIQSVAGNAGLAIGEKVPDFLLLDVDDPELRIESPAKNGRPLVLIFMKPDCPACKKGAAAIERVKYDANAIADWAVVLFSDKEECVAFRAAHGLTDLALCQDAAGLGKAFGVTRVPFGFFIDEEGVIRSKGPVSSTSSLQRLIADGLPSSVVTD